MKLLYLFFIILLLMNVINYINIYGKSHFPYWKMTLIDSLNVNLYYPISSFNFGVLILFSRIIHKRHFIFCILGWFQRVFHNRLILIHRMIIFLWFILLEYWLSIFRRDIILGLFLFMAIFYDFCLIFQLVHFFTDQWSSLFIELLKKMDIN